MDLEDKAKEMARRFGIPTAIFRALITLESGWDTNARSSSGAIGLTQVMPATARGMGYDPAILARNPEMQMEAGAKYLSSMYDQFQSWDYALAAYNAGPHNVKKYGGVPPFRETQNYVRRALALAGADEELEYTKRDNTFMA